jgi:hypothetical protein
MNICTRYTEVFNLSVMHFFTFISNLITEQSESTRKLSLGIAELCAVAFVKVLGWCEKQERCFQCSKSCCKEVQTFL